MKKIIYYLSVICIIFHQDVTMSAQVGVKAGIGISEIIFKTHGQSTFLSYDNNGVIHNLPKLSLQAGVFTTISIAEKWNIQPELLFTEMGIDYSTGFLYDDITYKMDINYLHLPVLMEYLIRKHDKTNLGLYLGPYLGFKLNANKIVEIDGVKTSNPVMNVKSHDYGLVTGFSYKRNMNSGVFSLDIRLGYGFINMMDPAGENLPGFSYTPEEYARNVGLMVTAGYVFNHLFNKNEEP